MALLCGFMVVASSIPDGFDIVGAAFLALTVFFLGFGAAFDLKWNAEREVSDAAPVQRPLDGSSYWQSR